jgi:murein DD-endopeptidase MepM/ murein hydrolase activator NlpD
MRTSTRFSFVAVAAVLVFGPAAPAGADTLLQRKSAVHQKKIQILAQIDVLKASDSQLDGAVKSLNAAVSAQLGQADAALSAVKAALDRQHQADAAIHATEARITSLRGGVITKAIEEYMRPGGTMSALAGTKSLTELGQRTMFLVEVAGKGSDALDQLHVARLDLLAEQKEAAKARAIADQRQKAANTQLQNLEMTRSAKSTLQAVLLARIAGYQAEANAVAAQEGNLEAFIRTQQLASQASRGGVAGGSGRVSGAGLIWPLSGPITSPFGPRYGGFHPGIDIGVPIGAPIHAAKAGTVIYASWMSGYGNVVIIDHGGGFSTLYAHQSRLTSSVGEQVSQGQLIGYSGNTGYSTGPHLHFETRVNGLAQNPMNYLP